MLSWGMLINQCLISWYQELWLYRSMVNIERRPTWRERLVSTEVAPLISVIQIVGL